MPTPDAIKKGLESCSADECHGDHVGCPYITSTMCIMYMANDALAYIKQLEQSLARVDDTHQKWISVKDRLPETQTEVLLYVKHNNGGTDFVAVGRRSHFTPNRYYIGAVTTAIDADRVTHWMPMPEPPKEDSHE